MSADCTLVSSSKKTYSEINGNKNLLLGTKSVGSFRRDDFQESRMSSPLHRPDHKDKTLNKESHRMLSNFALSKRPRIDQSDSYLQNFEADEDRINSQKDGFDLQSLHFDKTRMAKQKRGLDGKRTDRKTFKSGFRTRCDLFTSKSALLCGDSHSGGNILGTNSLKLDRSDITKLIDELSLNDLLDGSHKYSNINPGRGRRHPSVSENILPSVRKALSHLPNGATDSNGELARSNLKPSSSMKSLVHDQQAESIDEPETVPKVVVDGSELLEAKDIFGRLGLPSSQDLDSLLLGSPFPTQSGSLVKSFPCALLPQFPWTVSLGGSCRPNADSGKQFLNRSTGQSRWFRMENNSSSMMVEKHLLVDLKLAIFGANDHSLLLQKSDDLLCTQHLSSSGNLSTDVSNGMRSLPVSSNGVSIAAIHSNEGVPFSGSSVPKHQKTMEPGNFSCFGSDSHLVNSSYQFSDNGASLKIHHTSCTSYKSSCKDTVGDYRPTSQNQATLEFHKAGYCPRVLVAAEILFEIASSCNAVRVRNENGRKTKGWKVHSEKAVDATFKDVSESRSPVSRHCDPAMLTCPTPSRQQLEKKCDINYAANHSRGHLRSPVPVDCGTSILSSGRDLQFSPNRLNNVTAKPRKLIKSLSRVEKGYNNQQYLRKMRVEESTVGPLIKDWNTGRRKKSDLDGRS